MGIHFDTKLIVGWPLDRDEPFVKYLKNRGGKDDGKFDYMSPEEEKIEDFDMGDIEVPEGLYLVSSCPVIDEGVFWYVSIFPGNETHTSIVEIHRTLQELSAKAIKWVENIGDPLNPYIFSLLDVT